MAHWEEEIFCLFGKHETILWPPNFCRIFLFVCSRVSIQGVKSLWGDHVVFPRLGTGTTEGWRINLWDHPFKKLANFSQFLTPTPLPSAVFYYYPSANLANFWPLPPRKCRRLKWMVPYMDSPFLTFATAICIWPAYEFS